MLVAIALKKLGLHRIQEILLTNEQNAHLTFIRYQMCNYANQNTRKLQRLQKIAKLNTK